ncbi:hypothetical protein ASF71_01090 [Deinococcus sp. Leaf326]|nr:hypothetical protein ASF71_01090 [Deinococcus sp. Leaf326]
MLPRYPLTPGQVALTTGLQADQINRYIADGELSAVIHPEALQVFTSKRFAQALQVIADDRLTEAAAAPALSAEQMVEELVAADAVLLADYMESPDICGGFFTALAGAIRRADPGNRHSLYAAFPLTLYGYLQQQREWSTRPCPGCGLKTCRTPSKCVEAMR